MDKKVFAVGIVLASLIAVIGIASAQGFGWSNGAGQRGMGHHEMMLHHAEFEEILEHGNYADLVSLREEYGFQIMPWIESEADFQKAKEIHEKMEQYAKENGLARGSGFGCPMMG